VHFGVAVFTVAVYPTVAGELVTMREPVTS
jgi:hypothetical protein